jgi:hypothetical protein
MTMYGTGAGLRMFLVRARTWQRVVVALAMVGVGALLVALGQLRGGLVGVAGLILMLATARHHLRPHEPSRTEGHGKS